MPPAPSVRTPNGQAPWRTWAVSPWTALAVLAAFYAVLLAGVRDKSLTVDEPGHATAGHIYWQLGDYRFDPENGNLPKRWFALPLLGGEFRTPDQNGPAWTSGELRAVADEWLHRSGNDPLAMAQRGRAMAGLLAVALGAGVWLWSRRLFGPLGGMISLLLFILNPAVLANGALMTSDIACALFMLTSLAACWAVLEAASPLRVALSALAFGALCVTKMSAVVLVPVALALALIRVLRPRPLVCGWNGTANTRSQRATVLTAVAAIHAIVAAGVIWTAFGFRFSAFAPALGAPAQFQLPWERVLRQPPPAALLDRLELDPAARQRADAVFVARRAPAAEWSHASRAALEEVRRHVLTPAQGRTLEALHAAPPSALPARLAAFALRHRLLPEAYLYGYAYVWSLSGQHPGFFNGETRVGGWRWFFPYVFLVKTPLALLALLAVAITAWWIATSRGRLVALLDHAGLPLMVFSVVYWAVAIGSDLNIGHRHLLPVYPPLFILGGAACRRLPWPAAPVWFGRTLTPALLAILAIETVCWFPHYLAYFNGFVLPSQAHRHLVDSSLDWGQDLPAVARFLQRLPKPTPPTYLAYFGQAEPRTYGIATRRINVAVPDLCAVLPGVAPEQRHAALAEFVRRDPRYDPSLFIDVQLPSGPALLLLLRPEELRLTAGTYVISASFLPPLYAYAFGDWNARHEARYRELRRLADPLLSSDPTQRAAGLAAVDLRDWPNLWGEFETYRFARLTARLRQRQPDELINYSVLVYRLTPTEIDEALDGPPPWK